MIKNNLAEMENKITPNKRLIGIILFVVLLLLIPLIAMQFTSEVNWKINDFLIAGFLLLGTGFLLESILRKITKKRTQLILAITIIAILILVWIELAVGIFGTPLAGS